MWERLCDIDDAIIRVFRRWQMPMARASLFVVYFWFGILKVVGHSPASPMVAALQSKTLPFFDAGVFLVAFGAVEVIIGIAFLIPRLERAALLLMVLHMGTTLMPLVLVPDAVWTGCLTPTLEGQYIIKNVALLAVAAGIASRLVPLSPESR